MDINQLFQMMLSKGYNPMQAAMMQEGAAPQQAPQSPSRDFGQGILNAVLGGMFTNYNKIDQSEDAPWMSGIATDGIDQYLRQYLEKTLGNKLF